MRTSENHQTTTAKPVLIWSIVLTVWLAIVAGAGWLAHDQWIAPLATREVNTRQQIADLGQRILEKHRSLKEAQELAKRAGETRDEARRKFGDLPQGPSVVWFPVRLREHFERAGISVPVARLVSTREAAAVAGYRRSYWSLSVPLKAGTSSIREFLRAVSELEEKNGFVRVEDLVCRMDSANSEGYVAVLSVSAMVSE